jgi:hypothetical protein
MTADEVKVEKKKKKKAETKEEKEQHAAELEKKLEEGVEVNEIDAEVLTLESEEISKYTFLRLGFSEVMSSIKFCHYL